MKFHLKRSEDKQFYFVLIARNGQTLLTSETYTRKSSCIKAITSMRRGISTAKLVDGTIKTKLKQ
jgi:uncharacterized protein YegP (UPF0339 family)